MSGLVFNSRMAGQPLLRSRGDLGAEAPPTVLHRSEAGAAKLWLQRSWTR